jgi:hypothetical protein
MVVLFCSIVTNAKERTKAFELQIPDVIVENSLYSNLAYFDSREHNDNFGYVQTSMFNNMTFMIDETPLDVQLNNLIKHVVEPNSALGRTLLFDLRDINFSEITKSHSETGYCHIRISLFEEYDSQYYFISTLDTVVTIKAMDVTGKLIKSASEAITYFVINNLTQEPVDEVPYTIDGVRDIDYYEKDNLQLYNTEVYKDGIYCDFKSFVNQTPESKSVIPKFKNGNLTEIRTFSEGEEKPRKIKPQNIYAVIIDGNPYISTGKSYLPVYKENNEFKFVDDGNMRTNVGAAIGAGIVGGLFAGLMGGGFIYVPISQQREKVVMLIDHLSGQFIVTPERIY